MERNNEVPPLHFFQDMEAGVEIQKILTLTDKMEKKLNESREAINQIRTMFGNISKNTANSSHVTNEPKHDDLTQFLTAGAPVLLMPDMPGNTTDVDLDNIIESMKSYVEDLRKNYVVVETKERCAEKTIDNINLKQYAANLDQLVKQLGNIKFNKQNEASRNIELEERLRDLCEMVNMFTMMVEEKSKQSETNNLWRPMEEDNTALCYDNMINKLLSGIYEVTYLLKNRH